MDFLDKLTCEKLVAMGCKSESGFYYPSNHEYFIQTPLFHSRSIVPEGVPTFTPWDFVQNSEHARINLQNLLGIKKLDPEKCDIEIKKIIEFAINKFRHNCIDSEDAVKYICDAVEKIKL